MVYKLTYFDSYGRAENIQTPFGQIPVLEIDGKPLAQSFTIARYLAHKFNLTGKDEYETAVCDSIVDQYKDFISEVRTYWRVIKGFQEGDENKLKQEVFVPGIKKNLPLFVNFLKPNNSGIKFNVFKFRMNLLSGYLVGDHLTWADIVIASGMAELDNIDFEQLNGFPELRAHYQKIPKHFLKMVHYKLTYFDLYGRAEHIRQIFVVAGQNFEDVRIAREEWPALKSKTPFGQIPVLEVDGKPLAQSFTISRYLAHKFNLTGKDEYEAAVCDSIVDQYNDFINEIMPYKRVALGFLEGDKDKLRQDVYIPAIKKHFPFFVSFLKNNKSGFFVGDRLTWVDITLAHAFSTMDKTDSELIKDYPELSDHYRKIHSLPKIKEYLEKRPERPF
ncbi:hypothetical protein WR25_25892 [Diploscapter pachys]|uniref:glutathione transferase n=1 Tax=Diploscapter pachys TaxID=2018661 RepID=A0A2A2L1D8_9BILA|nr:hypothetical protein WR25_25892 [Diploscapter pachys]